MPDYRGGSNDVSRSAQEVIRRIRSGDTPEARRRELSKRAIIGGLQAGMMGMAGLIGKAEADDAQATDIAKKRAIMANAIRNAQRQVKLGGAGASMVPQSDTGLSGGGAAVAAMPDPNEVLRDKSKATIFGMKADELRASLPTQTPEGDVWNRRAFDQADEGASVLGRDISRSQSIMDMATRQPAPPTDPWEQDGGNLFRRRGM